MATVPGQKRILNISADTFIKVGGTPTQFLKADGSVDDNVYAINNHTHTEADITDLGDYLPRDGSLPMTGSLTLEGTEDILKFANDFVTIKRVSNDMVFSAYTGFSFYDTLNNTTRLKIDTSGDATFYGKIIRSGSSDSYMLLGGGGTKLLSELADSGHNHDSTYIRTVGDQQRVDMVSQPSTFTGANLEIYAPNSGVNTNRLSLRFHEGGQWYRSIRAYSGGFMFTTGESEGLVNIYAQNIYSGGNEVYHTGNLPTYDNYQSWNLKTNGIQRTTVQSGGTLDIKAQNNLAVTYGAGGVVTLDGTHNHDSTYLKLDTTSVDVKTAVVDLNSARTGMFFSGTGSANQPVTSNSHIISQAYSSAYIQQLGGRHNRLFLRHKENNTWNNWTEFYTTDNLTKLTDLTNDLSLLTRGSGLTGSNYNGSSTTTWALDESWLNTRYFDLDGNNTATGNNTFIGKTVLDGNVWHDSNNGVQPFHITRYGENAGEYVAHYLEDIIAHQYYQNDERHARFKWTINNTDTESNAGANANTHTFEFLGNEFGAYLYLDGQTILHSGNISSYQAGAHTHPFNDITDVNINMPINGNVLQFNSVTGKWENVNYTSLGLQASDIDTLAELNNIVADATLIDTNDPRLSDARPPTTHNHDDAYVNVSGDTMTGDLILSGLDRKLIYTAQRNYTLPVQGTRMAILNLPNYSSVKVLLRGSENNFYQPIELKITRSGASGTIKIIKSAVQIHTHSNDIVFSSDANGNIYAEKVKFSTNRILILEKVEDYKNNASILDGSLTDVGAPDECIHDSDWQYILNTPTTISGYGITDNIAYTDVSNTFTEQQKITSATTYGSLKLNGVNGSYVDWGNPSSAQAGRILMDTANLRIETASGHINFSPSGVDSLRISNIGNVGIGTTTTNEKLTVNGNAKATSFIKSGATNNDILLGDGTTKTITELGDGSYVNTSGDTMTGVLSVNKKLTLNSPDYADHLSFRRGIYGADIIITGTRFDFVPTADTDEFKFYGRVVSDDSIRGESFIKNGGTSTQFLKADGSVDSNSYLTSSGTINKANKLNVNPNDGFTGTYDLLWHADDVVYSSSWLNVNGATDTVNLVNLIATGNITGTSFIKSGGTSTQFLKADGSVDGNTYVTTDTVQTITGQKTFNTGSYSPIILDRTSANTNVNITFKQNGGVIRYLGYGTDQQLTWGTNADSTQNDNIWHTGNLTNLNQLTTRNYSDLQGIPSTFTPSTHTHGELIGSSIDNLNTLSGDAQTLRYDRFSSGKTGQHAGVINNANGVLTMYSHVGLYGKQLSFGDNDDLYIRRITNNVVQTWRKLWHDGNFNPANYATSSHSHTIADITSLQTTLDSKVSAADDQEIIINSADLPNDYTDDDVAQYISDNNLLTKVSSESVVITISRTYSSWALPYMNAYEARVLTDYGTVENKAQLETALIS